MFSDFIRNQGGFVVEQFYLRGSQIAHLHPYWNLKAQGIEVTRDIPYSRSISHFHKLDVYKKKGATGRLPVVFYIHGGGFRILSKESHWIMAQMFAREGYLVFNINYRLSEFSPFPGAIHDTMKAFLFVLEHAADFGGDIADLTIAGESAGANLALALSLAVSHRHESDELAREVFKREVKVRAGLPACGLFEVTNIARLSGKIPQVYIPILEHFSEHYLRGRDRELAGDWLLNPLPFLESAQTLDRPLPPQFITVGGIDPIADDSRRLASALEKRGAKVKFREYPWRHHAFHAFYPLDPLALECWRDHFDFLGAHPAAES